MEQVKCDWFATRSGLKMIPMEPRPEMINVSDIAHALSNVCRFAGHGDRFYSVAQHSVLVSQWLSPENQLWGLMHDAAEAYLGDMIRPIKQSPVGKLFIEAEERMMACIAERFGLKLPIPEEVLRMDTRVLVTEARDLRVITFNQEWVTQVDQYGYLPITIRPMAPKDAADAFYDQFVRLTQA